ERAVIISSLDTESDSNDSLSGGWDPSASGASSNNLTWSLRSNGGNLRLAGEVTTGATFQDLGEYFENGKGNEIPLGTLVTLNNGKVEPSKENEDVIGVVSGSAGIVLGDSQFSWQGRYLIGEFGEPLYEEIPDLSYELKENETEEDRPLIKVRKENPNYDPNKKQKPRSER